MALVYSSGFGYLQLSGFLRITVLFVVSMFYSLFCNIHTIVEIFKKLLDEIALRKPMAY